MDQVLWVALGGFAASLVDGALGMGFGPTSSTILLSAGVSPIATSATVNLAKVVTGVASAAAHWRLGNVDRRLVRRLAGPGAIGAILGSVLLVVVDGATIRPLLAAILVIVGIRLLWRFRRTPAVGPGPTTTDAADAPGVGIVAAAGGVTNGLVGAWGPVLTPFLLHRQVPPRVVVGSVNCAEVVVAVVSAGSLVGSIGRHELDLAVIAAMLAGGVVAAPLAAHAVRFLPARLLGPAMAALLLVTQTGELLGALGLATDPVPLAGVVVAVVGASQLPWPLGRPPHPAEASAGHSGVGIGDKGPDVVGELSLGQPVQGDRLEHGPERGA